MVINWPEKSKIKPYVIAGVALVVVVAVFWWSNSYSYKKALKKANKENSQKIDSIQKTKAPLLDSLEQKRSLLTEQLKNVNILEQKQRTLINQLQYIQNENNRLRNSYRSGSVADRVRYWARLTTEEDTITARNN